MEIADCEWVIRSIRSMLSLLGRTAFPVLTQWGYFGKGAENWLIKILKTTKTQVLKRMVFTWNDSWTEGKVWISLTEGRGEKESKEKCAAKKLESEAEKEKGNEEHALKKCRTNLPRAKWKPLFRESARKRRKAGKSLMCQSQDGKLASHTESVFGLLSQLYMRNASRRYPHIASLRNLTEIWIKLGWPKLTLRNKKNSIFVVIFLVNFFSCIRRLVVNRISPRSFWAPLRKYVTRSL